jgi:hypothetical protein
MKANTAPRSLRRHAVATAAGVALAAVTLTACGDDDQAAQVALGDVTVPAASAPAAVTSGASPTAGAPGSPSALMTTAAPGAAAGGTVVDALAELEVEDQRGDGTGVRVSFARLSSGAGHVAITSRDGQLLGSAPVTQGAQPVTIPLSPRVTASGELIAVLHGDDGDGRFDATTDPVVVDDDGEREAEDFEYVLS